MTGKVLWQNRQPTAEEIAAREAEMAAEAKAAEDAALKLAGIAFEGVMCSATSDDQAGLTAVLLAIQLQGAGFQPTEFRFANGNRLVISLANYAAFAAAWMPFRQSFFRAAG